MSLLARATKAAGVPSISDDGRFITAPLSWLPWLAGGSTVSEESALGLPTLFACVRVLSEDVASLPLILYRRLPGGGKERADDHELYGLFHDAPNPEMSSMVWRETLMTHLATWGNAYCEIVYDALGRLQLWPIPPGRIEVRFEGGRRVYYYLGTERKRMRDGTVWHVVGQSLNGLVGMSPVAMHRKTLGEHLATREFGSAFYRNMARPATVMKHPGELSPGAIERLAAQMEALKGSSNAGKTVVLEEGLDVKEIGVPPEDAQYIETRKLQREEVAQLYRMPQHKVGILDHATFSNIEHQAIDYVTGTLRPWLVRIEQGIKTAFLADEPDLYVEFLVDGLLRGDAKTRAEALATRWQHGTINADQWREIENEPPLPDGLGQTYYVPANYNAVTDEEPEPEVEEAPPPNVIDIADAVGKAMKSAQVDALVRLGESIAAQERMSEHHADALKAIAAARQPIHVTVEQADVNVPQPIVNVTPAITVPTPIVTVEVPEQRPMRRQLLRDGKVTAELVEEPI